MSKQELQFTDTIVRSIELAPEDWQWATWRQHLAKPRPNPAKFNQQVALARLAKVPQKSINTIWDWSKAEIAVLLSQEEAHFWLTAMTEVNWNNQPEDLANKMARRTFTGELSVEQIRNAIASSIETKGYLIPEIMLPLANLCSVEVIIDLLIENNDKLKFLTEGFRTYIVMYLTEEETSTLRQRLSSHLDLALWPTGCHLRPPVTFYLAAYIGLHEKIQTLVESWSDDHYQGKLCNDRNQRPQEIIFGLGYPLSVETHMRRLQLRLQPQAEQLQTSAYVRAWLAHTEYKALDYIRDSILSAENKEDAAALLEALALVKAPEAAPHMLELMLSSKTPRIARRWLENNPVHAIAGVIPVVDRHTSSLADAAIKFLQRMKHKGHEAFIRARLEQESVEIADRVRSKVLDTGKDFIAFDSNTTPEWLRTAVADVLAQTKVKSFTWVDPSDLPLIQVGKYCLNDEQVTALLLALEQSQLQNPHPFVSQLRVVGDRQSLDAFAWQLFECWLSEDTASKEKWAMIALVLLGTDTLAIKLASLIRVWPGENQHQRAVFGLQCLRAIGTDTALMQINGIAQKLKFKGLKQKAKQCMEDIAKDRGLSQTQLEDRIIPDCDLDERGSRVFNFGSRQFYFVLGADTKPMVRDDLGKLRTDLPKPGAKDDAELAMQAIADWKILKKQVSEVAKIQAERLEQAMVNGRRWLNEEFETLLVRHPLMTNLVRLLVWGGYDSQGQLIVTFRVTEDQTYADIEDQPCQLKDVTTVGVVHSLHLDPAMRSVWGELFSDYEIVPPFLQISRPIYMLEQGEAESTDLTRFQHISIPAITLVGTLEKLSWLRGVAEDAGIFAEHCKPFYGANVTAVVEYNGVPVGQLVDWDEQKIDRCFFVPGIYMPTSYTQIYPKHQNKLKLEQIDRVVISEVLSDLNIVTAKGKVSGT